MRVREFPSCDGCGLSGLGVVRVEFEGVGVYSGRALFMALCERCAAELPEVLGELGVLDMTAGAALVVGESFVGSPRARVR